MPTAEIISIKSRGLNLEQEDFEIAIIEETELRSHRDLFYDFLKNQEGAIIHIRNPENNILSSGMKDSIPNKKWQPVIEARQATAD